MVFRLATGLAVALVMVAGQGAWAQQVSENQVAAKTDWAVFEEQDPKECWAVSAPKETVNTRDGRVVSVRRGEILLMAFFRPAAGVKGQLGFTGGYPFAGGSTVTLDLDGAQYELFTEGEWAWPASAADDGKIIAAMKRGSNAVLTARSARGTVTKDSFSLLGFTAALDEADKRCQ
ncbi:MAG: invasion associated locus B family protein [Lutimaribacter sp.]